MCWNNLGPWLGQYIPLFQCSCCWCSWRTYHSYLHILMKLQGLEIWRQAGLRLKWKWSALVILSQCSDPRLLLHLESQGVAVKTDGRAHHQNLRHSGKRLGCQKAHIENFTHFQQPQGVAWYEYHNIGKLNVCQNVLVTGFKKNL